MPCQRPDGRRNSGRRSYRCGGPRLSSRRIGKSASEIWAILSWPNAPDGALTAPTRSAHRPPRARVTAMTDRQPWFLVMVPKDATRPAALGSGRVPRPAASRALARSRRRAGSAGGIRRAADRGAACDLGLGIWLGRVLAGVCSPGDGAGRRHCYRLHSADVARMMAAEAVVMTISRDSCGDTACRDWSAFRSRWCRRRWRARRRHVAADQRRELAAPRVAARQIGHVDRHQVHGDAPGDRTVLAGDDHVRRRPCPWWRRRRGNSRRHSRPRRSRRGWAAAAVQLAP